MSAATSTTPPPSSGVPQIYQLFIRATPQAVWEAITTPELTRQYFYGSAVQTEARPDGAFNYLSPDGQSLWGRGTIAEWDPPHRLVHTWRSLYDPRAHDEPASRVTWEITEQEGGYCLLRVTHDHLEHSPITADGVAGEGWMLVLSGLKSVVETGQGLIATKEA
ncbi:SRPBCC family protein [Actinomyces bowdenii]|nr:SRPBCC family protein [Actinomyces bowdenii]MCR2053507.1 SRPBCC family protein [Actinomyces bowdenii]